MNPIHATPETLNVAQRVVWFKSPAEALADPIHFLAHVMTYGTIEDIIAVNEIVTPAQFLEALEQAPPGIFDSRSWAYWNVKFGRDPVPPMPTRQL